MEGFINLFQINTFILPIYIVRAKLNILKESTITFNIYQYWVQAIKDVLQTFKDKPLKISNNGIIWDNKNKGFVQYYYKALPLIDLLQGLKIPFIYQLLPKL